MAIKVSSASGATMSSGVHRRPRLMLRPIRPEDIGTIIRKHKTYASPVRIVGCDYSQARCVGGDGGTLVDTSALDKILEFGEGFVRAQAGVRIGTLVRALAERGFELPLTPEIANISLGAVAVTTLPQASFQDGLAQMSACVMAMKIVTPQGKELTVTQREAELLRVLRSSFGLLGVVHEVTLRVVPLRPVKIDYRAYSLEEFTARYAEISAAPGALRLHLAPFSDRVTVERRTFDVGHTTSRSGIWQIRNSVMRNVLPAFGASVGSVLATPGLRNAILTGVHKALGATQAPAARGVVVYAHEWMRDLPAEPWKARYTKSLWAFAAAGYPRVLADYFAFCRGYFKEHRYRPNVVTAASRMHRDRSSLFSVSYNEPMLSLEPSSDGAQGWADFLIDFNDFAASLGGVPTFNQSRALKAEHIEKAFGERARLFKALRRRTDALNRLDNSYFANLLG